MTYTRLVKAQKGHALPLPKEFAHRLGLRRGQSVIVQLIEEAGVILIIPAAPRSSPSALSPKASPRSARKHPRYDRVFDSAREILSEPAPFASAVIQADAVQSLQAIPSLE